jgi:rubrerythrin
MLQDRDIASGKELAMKVLRFAQEIDQSAQRFYEEMASHSDNPGIGMIFRMLADDEDRLLKRHKALATRGDAVDAEALDRGVNVFEQLRRREEYLHVHNDVEAYRLALEAEREVLRQYRSAVKTEKHPAVRRVLSQVARDEEQHIAELENLYDFANAPNHYLAWGEFSNLGDFNNFGRDTV